MLVGRLGSTVVGEQASGLVMWQHSAEDAVADYLSNVLERMLEAPRSAGRNGFFLRLQCRCTGTP